MADQFPTKQNFYDAEKDLRTVSAVSNSRDPDTGAEIDSWQTRTGGQTDTLAGRLKALGIERIGDFTAGCTVTKRNQGVLEVGGSVYVWLGVIPTGGKVVPPMSTPASTGGIGPTGWLDVGDASLRGELGVIVGTYSTAASIPSSEDVGGTVRTLGRYQIGVGPGTYRIMSGTSPHPLVDPQIATGKYAKLLPLEGTNYNYSLLAAGGKNNLTSDNSTTTALNQLLAKIAAESPVIGGLVVAEGGQYYLSGSVLPPAANAKHLGIIGEYSNLSYGTYESRTIFYFDNGLVGDFAFDFFNTQFMTFSDFALRGDVGATPTKGGLRLGKAGSFAPGYGNHLVERVQGAYCTDGLLFKNAGISTVRDLQFTHCLNRGLALETSGDSNLYNVYANDCNKDTTDISLFKGSGVYIGQGSNNTNIFGGKLEFNSKGLVVHGSNGINMVGLQYDYNKMANLIAVAIDDAANACRGLHSVGCRYLSGGVITGYQFSSIYLDTTFGSASLSITGGGIQAAGDGAFDTSSSGVIGPQVGVYGNGNNTYSLDVIGGDLILINPGVSYAAVANGGGTKIKLSGSGEKKATQQLSGGKCFVGFNSERTDAVALAGASGSATYSNAICDTVVVDGIATMDIILAVSSVSSLTGAIYLVGLPFSNTGSQQACVTFGMISSVNNTPTGMLGYVLPGENRVTLWKRQADGSPAQLQGGDITSSSLMRMSIRMNVS